MLMFFISNGTTNTMSNPATDISTLAYSLNPTQFDSVFPFHFVIGSDLLFRHLGNSLEKLIGEPVLGRPLQDFFQLHLPQGYDFSAQTIIENIDKTFVFILTISGMKLRGSFIHDQDQDALLFLGTPWVLDVQQLESFQISMNDFSPHDPMYDLLTLNEIQKQNLKDANTLRERLERKAIELKEFNTRLDQKVQEKTEFLNISLRQVADTQKRLKLILDSINNLAIFMTDVDGNIISWNSGAQNLLGYSEAEILGHHLIDIFGVYDQLVPEKNNSRPLKDRQIEYTNPDGVPLIINLSINVVENANKFPEGYAYVMQDVTQKLKLEKMAQEIEKFDTIGQLTGGLAHDFNNLLGIVVANLENLENLVPNTEFAQTSYKLAIEASLRASEVTRSLLAISRRNMLELKRYDLNQAVTEVLPLLESTVSRNIEISTDMYPGELLADIDLSGFTNALLNLVINAKDALQEKFDKRITISSRRVFISEHALLPIKPGWYNTVKVHDTGCGIDASIRHKILQPYFSTKNGKGTGLGLSMVHGFITQIGGYLDVDSTPGKHTDIELYFPVPADITVQLQEQEKQRLSALYDLHILDTERDERYDRLIKEAKSIAGCKYAFLSFVDRNRQWFKSESGLKLRETRISDSICAHAILDSSRIVSYEKLDEDRRFCGKNVVTGLKLKTYFGIQLTDKNGVNVGMLGIADTRNITLEQHQIEKLTAIADKCMDLVYEDLSKYTEESSLS